MSRRYVMRVLTTPTDLLIECRRLQATVETLKARNAVLRADRAAAGRLHEDLDGANRALITEVAALRVELRTARAINVTQARLLRDRDGAT